MKRKIIVKSNRNEFERFAVSDDDVNYSTFLKDFLKFFNTVPMVFELKKEESDGEECLTLTIKLNLLAVIKPTDEHQVGDKFTALSTFYSKIYNNLSRLFTLRFSSEPIDEPYTGNEITLFKEKGSYFRLIPKRISNIPKELFPKHFVAVEEGKHGIKAEYAYLCNITPFFVELNRNISENNVIPLSGYHIPAAVIDALVDLPDNYFKLDSNVIYTSDRDIRKALNAPGGHIRVCFFNEGNYTPVGIMFIHETSIHHLHKALVQAIPDYEIEYRSEERKIGNIDIILLSNYSDVLLKRFEETYTRLLKE